MAVHIYVLTSINFSRLFNKGRLLACVNCGTPLWELLGHFIIVKPGRNSATCRCLGCAIRHRIVTDNIVEVRGKTK